MSAARVLAKGTAGARIGVRLMAMAGLLAACVILFHIWRAVKAPNPWPRRFLAGIAYIAGVRIRIAGTVAPGRLLMLANHVSWMDIPALASATGTAFVAHDGLAQVPLLRWLCAMNDTVFVARGDRGSIAAQIGTLRAALDRPGGTAVTLFPEGTTSDGTGLLAFKSALLAALDPLPPGAVVQPVWLDYGPQVAAIAWVGEEAGPANFARILARAQAVHLTIHMLAPLTAAALANRKTMAVAASQAIGAAMRHARSQADNPLQSPGDLA